MVLKIIALLLLLAIATYLALQIMYYRLDTATQEGSEF